MFESLSEHPAEAEPRSWGELAPAAVAVIADSHLGGPGGEAAPLVRQLQDLAAAGCRRVVLLGDIFHVWVALPGFETEEVRAVVGAVAELRRQGVRVEYVEGNRDFFVATGPYREDFDGVVLETSFEVGGRRFLAVHGDGLNDRDYQYRFWRWLSKSAPTRWAMRLIPRPLSRRWIHATDRRLSRTNFKHKWEIPEAVIRAYGERRLAEGYDVLLLGHFHEPRCWTVEGGEIWLLDAWFNSRRVELPGASQETSARSDSRS
jgi:UDP-2,3-diacylglucosamine hydrolase